MKNIINLMHQFFSRNHIATRFAVKIGNQANAIVRARMNDGIDSSKNGEELLLKCLAPIKIAIDVGANKGSWSRAVMAESFGELEKIIAFEPSASARDILIDNFRSEINLGKIEIRPIAVTDYVGRSIFFADDTGGELGSLGKHASLENNRKYEVAVSTLDNELVHTNIKFIDILKIDAEGFDGRVLLGARELLKKQIFGAIQFEYNKSWTDAGCTLRQIIDLLQSFDYEVYLLKSDGLHLYPYEIYGEYFGYSNFCAISRTSKNKFITKINLKSRI